MALDVVDQLDPLIAVFRCFPGDEFQRDRMSRRFMDGSEAASQRPLLDAVVDLVVAVMKRPAAARFQDRGLVLRQRIARNQPL